MSLLQDNASRYKDRLLITRLCHIIEDELKLEAGTLLNGRRHKDQIFGRNVLCYVLKEQYYWREYQIASAIERDRSTVIKNLEIFKNKLSHEAESRIRYQNCIKKLNQDIEVEPLHKSYKYLTNNYTDLYWPFEINEILFELDKTLKPLGLRMALTKTEKEEGS